jgi:hypothetical protein
VAQEHTFDIVSSVDLQEVKNAIAQALKEVRQRYDFKGSRADVVLDEKERVIEISAEDDMKVRNLDDLLMARLVKRSLPLKAFDFQPAKAAGGSMLRQQVLLQQGIPIDKAREIVKLVKGSKRKVQVAIQGDQVRVSARAIDELQAVIQLLKDTDLGIDMQFTNYR